MRQHIENQLKKLPNEPGIYLFYNAKKELIYVGKATSLKQRVRSYFRGKKTPRPIEEMIHEVATIKWKVSDSVLEAIILESIYIKKYQPQYNVIGKDNKSWNYIVITKDEYPLVTTKRQYQMSQMGLQEIKKQYAYVFGPFPGLNTRAVMKLLRRLFYISDCQRKLKTSKKLRALQKPCLYRQMGMCLGVCTGEISPTKYKTQVIKPLVLFLRGGKKQVLRSLQKKMITASKQEQYEEAARLRDQIHSLEKIHDVALLNKNFFDDPQFYGQSDYALESGGEIRIEGYDISNLGASGKVGSMVVFDTAGPQKNQYRKFKIKSIVGQSDVDCLEEVLTRRLKHSEWPLPSIFLIDGGTPQVNRVKKVLEKAKVHRPVVGIAKGPTRKKNEFVLGNTEKHVIDWVSKNQELLVQVRDEAHRFAIQYQRKLR